VKNGRWLPGDMQRAPEAARNLDFGSNMDSHEYYVPKPAQKRHLDGRISDGWDGSLHQFLIESSTN
jgi:hypothetical protein